MENNSSHVQQTNYKLGISRLHMARLKKKILIFGYDFPNITFDAVVHFTNIFYILFSLLGTPNTF